MIIAATRYGSTGGSSKLPAYTYTGLAPIERKAETGDNWELVFQRPANASSGPTTTITFTKNVAVEIFAVGGGQAGEQGGEAWEGTAPNYTNSFAYGGDGGNGGETKTATKQLLKDVAYSVTVGGSGMSTSFDDSQHTINVTAESGAGAAGGSGAQAKSGGSAGGDGGDGVYAFGQNTTDGLLYNPSTKYGAGGGGGGATSSLGSEDPGDGGDTGGGNGGVNTGNLGDGSPGAANTGAGGGGGRRAIYFAKAGGAGGSGIVIIRNARSSS